MIDTVISKNIYARPPIAEAIIDIRAKDSISLAMLKNCVDLLSSDYQNISEINDISVEVNMESPLRQSTYEHKVIGHRMSSHFNNEIVLIQQRGFTISQVNNYKGWEDFKSKALMSWSIFKSSTNLLNISRLALRYVNKIIIQEDRFKIEDYFNLAYKVPDKLAAEDISGLFIQLHIPMLEIHPKALCVINFLSVAPEVENTSTIILDFDLFIQDEISLNIFDLWSMFDLLRDKKNELFEMCITDKTRELFT